VRDNGYVVGENVALEYRAAQSNVDLLRRAALELAALPVNVFVTEGTPATRAARQATSTIPIVMIAVGDPVRAGFVTNLARRPAISLSSDTSERSSPAPMNNRLGRW
jgi:putative ABC transport system substrate-binding protein